MAVDMQFFLPSGSAYRLGSALMLSIGKLCNEGGRGALLIESMYCEGLSSMVWGRDILENWWEGWGW